MLAKGQEKPSVGSQENGEQLPASEAFEVHVPRNQYLRKTKEELVDIIISLQQSPAPMEQPQLQVRSVAPDSSGTACLRESYMRTTEQLLEGIDGLVECFGFAKECIHESCERNIQEGRKRIDQLKSQLDALRSSLQSLVFKQQSGGMLLREQIDSEQGLVKRCNDKVDAIVKKVSDLEESFEAFGKGSDSIKAGVKSANDQWHERPHRQVSESLDRISRSHSQVNAIADYVKAYQDHVEDMSDCNEELHGGISVRTAGLGGIIHELKEKEKENSELNRRLEAVEKRLEALGIGAAVDVGYPKQRVDDSSPSKYVTGREEIYTPQIPPVPRDVGEGKEQTDTPPSGAGIQAQSISGQGTPRSSKSVPIPKKQTTIPQKANREEGMGKEGNIETEYRGLEESSLTEHVSVPYVGLPSLVTKKEEVGIPQSLTAERDVSSQIDGLIEPQEETHAPHSKQNDGAQTQPGSLKTTTSDLLASYEEACKTHGMVTVKVVRTVLVGPSEVGKSSLCHLLIHGSSKEVSTSTSVIQSPDVLFVDKHYSIEEKTWKQVSNACLSKSVAQCAMNRDYKKCGMYPAMTGAEIKGKPVNQGSSKTLESLEDALQDLLQLDTGKEDFIPLCAAKFIHMIDSGGQPAFQDVLPLLLSGPCTYLLIFDASRRMSDQIQATYRPTPGDTLYLPEDQPTETQWEFILRTLSTIQTMADKYIYAPSGCKAMESSQSNFQVAFVGTFKDKVVEEQDNHVDAISKHIHGLAGKPYYTNIRFPRKCPKDKRYRRVKGGKLPFFFISNVPNDHMDDPQNGLEKLRESINNSSAQSLEVPLVWILLMQVTRNAKEKFLKREELKAFCLKHHYIDEDAAERQFSYLLHLLHALGFYVYLDLHSAHVESFVCTDATFFYREVSKLLAVQYYDFKSGAVRKFQQMGVIESSHRTEIFDELEISPKIDPTWFLEVLCYLGIAGRLSSIHPPNFCSYFIPSCLPYGKSKDSPECFSVGSLHFTFVYRKDNFSTECDLPRGVFCRLVVELTASDMVRIVPHKSTRNSATFMIKQSHPQTKISAYIFLKEEPGHMQCDLIIPESAGLQSMSDAARTQNLHEQCVFIKDHLKSNLNRITREMFGEKFKKIAQIQPVVVCHCQQLYKYYTALVEDDNTATCCDYECGHSHDLSPEQKVWFSPLTTAEARVTLTEGTESNERFWKLALANAVGSHEATVQVPHDHSVVRSVGEQNQEGGQSELVISTRSYTNQPPQEDVLMDIKLGVPETVTDTGSPRDTLKLYQESFSEKVRAPAISTVLYNRQVIPEDIKSKIERSNSTGEANGLLYDHLKSQADFCTLTTMATVMCEDKSYAQMCNFAKDFKDILERQDKLCKCERHNKK